MLYLDNLKIVLIAGVIAAHSMTAYLGGGTWTTKGSSAGVGVAAVIGGAGLLGAMFWLGLFFLISGLFASASLTRHGAGYFLRDRLLRLGVPLAAYVLLVMPALDYIRYVVTYSGKGQPEPLGTWLAQYVTDPNPGPMWFVAVLLLLSAGYAAWWRIRPRAMAFSGPLRLAYLVGLAAIIMFSSFTVHLIWPIASRQFMDLHLWQWPQYFLLFWFGIISARPGWLAALPDRLWHRCGWTIVVVALIVAGLVVAGGALSGQLAAFAGGWHWQAVVMAGVEGVFAVAGSLWVLDFFRRYFSHQGPISRQLARSAYGAFVVHTPVLTGLFLALRLVPMTIELKILVLATSSVIISYAFAWLLIVRLRLGGGIL